LALIDKLKTNFSGDFLGAAQRYGVAQVISFVEREIFCNFSPLLFVVVTVEIFYRVGIHRANFANFTLDLQSRLYIGFTVKENAVFLKAIDL
jgi:hypothetical protein